MLPVSSSVGVKSHEYDGMEIQRGYPELGILQRLTRFDDQTSRKQSPDLRKVTSL